MIALVSGGAILLALLLAAIALTVKDLGASEALRMWAVIAVFVGSILCASYLIAYGATSL